MSVALGVFFGVLIFWLASGNQARMHRLRQLQPSSPKKEVGRKSVNPGVGARIEKLLASDRLPQFVQDAMHRKRIDVIERQLPMTVDLFRLAIGSGMNVSMALLVVAPRVGGQLGSLLNSAAAASARGVHLGDALQSIIEPGGQGVRYLVEALQASGKFGSPIVDSLERLSGELRLSQGRKAEQRAKKLSVQLLFPLAGCVLPAFVLLAIVPLLAGSVSTLASSFS